MRASAFFRSIVFAGIVVVAWTVDRGQGRSLTTEEAQQIATDAYVYGYPLVTMEMTRRVMTNVATVEGQRAPMGQFVNAREYPTAAFKDVTAPNADTLYSSAWLDLSKEPYVLSIPDEGDRYYLMPMLERLDRRVPGSGETHHRRQSPDLRHHRPRLEGRTSRGGQGTQVADQHGLDPRPHLLHRHA